MVLFTRCICTVIGAAILFGVAHLNVVAHGGYGSTAALSPLIIALGVVGASFAIGQLVVERKPLWVLTFIAILACAEATNFLTTAERVIESREIKQAPLRARERERSQAQAHVDAAKEALAAIPSTTERIRKAEAAKAAADAAVIQKSAERGCVSNCRQLLQAQVDAAQAELNAARAELQSRREAAEADLRAARAALGGMEASAAASPLADRLGLKPWLLDVLNATLTSTSLNGLACALLVFGTHSRTPRQRSERTKVKRTAAVTDLNPSELVEDATLVEEEEIDADPVIAFMKRNLPYANGASTDVDDIYVAFRQEAEQQCLEPLSRRQFDAALQFICNSAGIEMQRGGDSVYVLDRKLRRRTTKAIASSKQARLGHMVQANS